MSLTDRQVETVVSYVDGFDRVLVETGMREAALEDALLDHNVERCKNVRCGWWTESHNLLADGEDEPDGYCDNCRKYDKPKMENEE